MEVESMFEFATASSWSAMHPEISHFPIVLLLVAPIFVLLALWRRAQRSTLMAVAVGLLVAGTLGAYLSASSGDAAKSQAPETAEVKAALEHHESLASAARAVFTGMSVLLLALQYGPVLAKRSLSPRTATLLSVVFLILYVGAVVVLLDAAHSGGVLVHKLGVHARLG
jgi:uncharacterized membrane protein